MRRRSIAAVAMLAAMTTGIGLAPASASSPHLADLVGQVAVPWTPNVSGRISVGKPACNATFFGGGTLTCLSEVYGTAYVNGDVVVAGAFTHVCQPGTLAQGLCTPGTQVARDDIFAYQAATGRIDPHFKPPLDKGPAWTVIPGPAGSDTVYVGGAFTHVSGLPRRGIVQLNVNPGVTKGPRADGSVVTGFRANVSNMVRALALSPDGTAIYAGGQFVTANGVPETGLVRVSAKTGAVDPSFSFTLGDPADSLPLKIEAMDLSSDGRLLAFAGTALQVNGQPRPRLAVVATGGTLGAKAALTAFTAPILANNCSGEHDYVRALRLSRDGSFLVIGDTGFQGDRTTPYSVCDAVARFDLSGAALRTNRTSVSVAPSWINYSGGDSFYSVAIAGSVVYAGGHNRWVNNFCGVDSLCEQNALYQGGLSAFDANTGIGLAWWHPQTLRGAGTMYLDTFGTKTYDGSHAGLALGTDVDVIAGTYHSENALLPVIAATTKTPFGVIPSGMFNEEGGSLTATAMCLDDPGDSSSTGTAIDIANCLNLAQQNWTVPAPGTTGPITIHGLCLGVKRGGTGVVLATCSASAATQRWAQGNGNSLINEGASAHGRPMCLDDPSGSTTSGTPLNITGCSGGQNQVWPLPTAPGPAAGPPSGPIYPQQTQVNTQQPCLDDANDAATAGNKIQLWTCRGGPSQDWKVVPASPSGAKIKLGASSFCLDTRTGTRTVVLNPCGRSSSQIWAQGPDDSLVQRSSGLCLDDGGNTANGSAAQVATCVGGGARSQAWRIPGW